MESTESLAPAAVPSLAGVAALDCLAVMKDLVGEPVYVAALERVPAAIRHQIETITAVSWLPVASFNTYVDELAHVAGLDPEALLDKVVRLSVNRTFKTVWRMLLRVTSDEALIKRTPMIYARGRNYGQLAARVIEPGRAELLLTGYPDRTDRALRTLGVGIQSVVELAGRKDVKMSYTRTPDGGRFEIRWRP